MRRRRVGDGGRRTWCALLLALLPGWRSDLLDRVAIDKDAMRLATLPGLPRLLNAANGDFGGLTLPAALAVDRQGRIYLLQAETASLRRYNSCDERFERLACIGGHGWAPRRFHTPRCIAISCRDELYVGDTGNRRVQIFCPRQPSAARHLGALCGRRHKGRRGASSRSRAHRKPTR